MKAPQAAKVQSFKISALVSVAMLARSLVGAQCALPSGGMVGWWPGEGDATDIIGGNNGTLINGTGFAPGQVDQAFKLDGTSNYVQIPDSTALKPVQVTVEAWVKLDSIDTSALIPIVTTEAGDHSELIPTRQAYSLRIDPAFACFNFYVAGVVVSGAPLNNFASVRGDTVVTIGQFYHVVGTYDPPNIRLYVNGILDHGFSPNVNLSLLHTNKPIFIGAFGTYTNGYSTNKLAGEIDEVSIYDRALSASEVASLYAAGSAGKCKTPCITSPPQSQTGYWGQSTTFSVETNTNYPPLTYQWLSNGVPVLDATNQNLLLTNLQNSFAAGYSVAVSNPNGSVTSAPPAILTIATAKTTLILIPVLLIEGAVGYT